MERVRNRLSQSWTVYGQALRPTPGLRRTVGHATRTWMSATLVGSQLRYLMGRPRDSRLPAQLEQELAVLDAGQGQPVTWLVHHRPNTGRTLVHEIDAQGQLLSVVKLGRASDLRLAHEAAVLSALGRAAPPRPVLVPTVLGFEQHAGGGALRTRLELAGVAQPPYRWGDAMLAEAAGAIQGLRQNLLRLPPETLAPEGPGALEGVPSHGDFTPWNLFVVRSHGARLFGVIDFEQAGRWPAWWDPTRLLMSALEERRIAPHRSASTARLLGVRRDEASEYVAVLLQDHRGLDGGRRRDRLERFAASIEA